MKKQSQKVKGFLFYFKETSEPVGCVWVGFKGFNEFQYRIRNIDAFGFDFAVAEKWRGKEVIRYMVSILQKELEKNGIKKLFISVRRNNISALKAYQKCGCSVVKNVLFLDF
ncbi:MAG: GNAT family N-acetyltransferase [Clostridia bacterium]|nr:GNAT family N-acetyltransferase [Clostridia bacterium]